MSDNQNIKRLILPAIKGIPILIGIFCAAMYFANNSLKYSTYIYESHTKIKLDDNSTGFSNGNLYKDLDYFAHKNIIEGEVEVFKSKALIRDVLQQLPFDVSYHQMGVNIFEEKYYQSPIKVEYKLVNDLILDERINIQIPSKEYDSIYIDYTIEGKQQKYQGFLNDTIFLPHLKLCVLQNDSFVQKKKDFSLKGTYFITINSLEKNVALFKENIDVKAMEDDVPIVRIAMKNPVPEKTNLFLNKLGETYINNFIKNRSTAAEKTVMFIDDQLDKIRNMLSDSEAAIERYKLKNDVINTRQETETNLKKLSQLKIQLSGLDMKEVALDTLNRYINQEGKDFMSLAPNFEAFGDLLFVEVMKKIKLFEEEKKDLKLRYTDSNEKITVIEEKIEDLISYVKEGIKNVKKDITIRKGELLKTIEKSELEFLGLPSLEKDLVILQRDFQLNQKLYNFYMEKRSEAAIAQAANIAFHKIIEPAELPIKPVSPNKTLLKFISGLLGILIGVIIVYGKEAISKTIQSKGDLEKHCSLPVLGVIRKSKKQHKIDRDFENVINNLSLVECLKPNNIITVTSSVSGEGKSFIARNISRGFARSGFKTLYIDLNLHNPDINGDKNIADLVQGTETIDNCIRANGIDGNFFIPGILANDFSPSTILNHPNLFPILEELKTKFDRIIIDTPGTAIAPDAIQFMRYSDINLYVIKVGKTSPNIAMNADLLKDEYGLKNIKMLLNNAHKATNYNGNYIGSRYSYKLKRGIFNKIKHYIHFYMK